MLVLALQFSRSYLTTEPASRFVSGKADQRLDRRCGMREDSLKTEEKTVAVADA